MSSAFEPKSFYIYVRHCPRRSLDATRLYKYFVKNGLKSVDSPKNADLIVIYTCGGFKNTEEESVFTIEASLKTNAKVIITGCLPKINPEVLAEYGKAKIIFVEDLCQLDSLINAKFPYTNVSNQPIVCGVNDLLKGSFLQRFKRNFEFSYDFLKNGKTFIRKCLSIRSKNTKSIQKYYKIEIARGCLGGCSYCVIRKAMEKFHSFSEDQLVENFRSGLKEGYSDFAIMAGDIGCYGLDIKTNLPNLLKKLFAIEGKYRFLLVDLNPAWLKKYYSDLLSILKDNSEKVSRIIIPIQSGSDRILKLMKRNYKIEDVKKFLLDLQSSVPSIEIETHIMVGFPGETPDDFRKSINILKEINFACVQIYKYEDRPGAPSSKLTGKVDKKTIEKRARTLAKESKTHHIQYGIDGLRI